MQEHRREVLRAASVALQGRAVTLWEVSSRAEVTPVMTSAASSRSPDTRLDLDSTLHRWGAPIIQGSRWVGCRLDDTGPWCVAPVRRQPAAPPPDGVERGEITGRVKDAAVAGNAYELLKRISGFGTDGRWYGARHTPSLLLEGVSVARR